MAQRPRRTRGVDDGEKLRRLQAAYLHLRHIADAEDEPESGLLDVALGFVSRLYMAECVRLEKEPWKIRRWRGPP